MGPIILKNKLFQIECDGSLIQYWYDLELDKWWWESNLRDTPKPSFSKVYGRGCYIFYN